MVNEKCRSDGLLLTRHLVEWLAPGRLSHRRGVTTGRGAAELLRMDALHFPRAFKRVHGLSPPAFVRSRGVC